MIQDHCELIRVSGLGAGAKALETRNRWAKALAAALGVYWAEAPANHQLSVESDWTSGGKLGIEFLK